MLDSGDSTGIQIVIVLMLLALSAFFSSAETALTTVNKMRVRTLAEAGAAWFAVSSLAEARHLRRGGVTQPILILGMTRPEWAAALAEGGITQAVYSPEYARALSRAAEAAGVTGECHLKIDTGMGRIGFGACRDLEGTVSALLECRRLPGLSVTGAFQHFSVADSPEEGDCRYTEGQYALFRRVVERLEQGGEGLNLTYEVRRGILCHTGPEQAETLEGRLLRLADKIAYINHDIDDAIRGRIIYPMDLPLAVSQTLGFTHSERINSLVRDIIETSAGRGEILQSPPFHEAMKDLREFMFAFV